MSLLDVFALFALAMGMERINFFWYAKNIGGLALLGYVAGSAVYFAAL